MLLALLAALQSEFPVPDLSAFKPFLGACWRSEFSATVSDTHCFDTLYRGAHVLDRHEVKDKGKTIYAGETIYSVDGPDLVFTYVNSRGGMGLGKVGTTGRTLGFTGSMRPAPDKPEQEIDSEWRMIDADHYEVRSLVPSKNGQPDKPLIFSRVVEPKPR
jgi:hypothetical protein